VAFPEGVITVGFSTWSGQRLRGCIGVRVAGSLLRGAAIVCSIPRLRLSRENWQVRPPCGATGCGHGRPYGLGRNQSL